MTGRAAASLVRADASRLAWGHSNRGESAVGPSRLARLAAPVLGCALAFGLLSGCSAAPAATPEGIDALENIGDGLKAEYKQRLAEANDDAERERIGAEAAGLSAVVGRALRPVDMTGDSDQSRFSLNEDGTVTATDPAFHALMSNATHWRVGDSTIDLCTDDTCRYYSSWDLTWTPAGDQPEKYRFTINTNGVEDDDSSHYRELYVAD